MLIKSNGTLEAHRVADALNILARRHDALRTCFVEGTDGEPAAKLVPVTLECPVVEASDAKKEAERLALEPFDLARAPLWRAEIVRTPGAPDHLAVSIHHIVSDVWSLGIMLAEFLALYEGRPLGTAPQLRFVDWAAEGPSPDARAHARRTAERLAGIRPSELPLAHERPEGDTLEGENFHAELSARAVRALWKTATRLGVTPFTITTALWGSWLREETGRDELLFGMIDAGRDDPRTGPMMGFFAETVPVRLRVRAADTLEDTVREAASALTQARKSLAPFEMVLEERHRLGDDGPALRLMLVQDSRNDIFPMLRQRGWDAFEIDTPTAQFDVAVYFSEDDDRLHVKVAYASALFDRADLEARIGRLLARFEALDPDGTPDGTHFPSACPGTCASSRETSAPLERTAPLAHQERLWFVDRFEKGDLYEGAPIYYNQVALRRLSGPLPALDTALQTLSARREALCVSLEPNRDEHPQLCLHAPRPLPLVRVADEAELYRAALEPFEVSNAPLARVIVAETPPMAAISVHHLVADAQGAESLLDDLIALAHAPEAPLPEDASLLAAAREEASHDWKTLPEASWWKATLEGMGKLELPGDHPRTAIQLFHGVRKAFRVPDLPVETVRAAFAALLHRITQDRDVTMGDVLRGRPLANLLPLRSVLEGDETLERFLARYGDIRRDATLHGHMPFDHIVLAANPENDMSRTALFDVLFAGEDAHTAKISSESVLTGLGWGKYDLVLAYRNASGSASSGEAVFVYNSLFFEAETIERMMRRFVTLLEAVASGERRMLEANVLELPLTLPEDSPNVEASLARIDQALDALPETIAQSFRLAADRFPSHTALVDPLRGVRLRYDELDARTNALARGLAAEGAAPEKLVAVLKTRDLGTIEAFLGIAKAGAGYVPLDDAYPDERLEMILETARPLMMLTDAAHRARTEALVRKCSPETKLVLLDDLRHNDATSVPCPATGSNIAYVLFTSGSTGRPKGVIIENHSVAALILQKGLPFEPDPSDVWSIAHSSAFDYSVWEMYGALLTGGTAVLLPREWVASPDRLADALVETGVTRLSMTPTAFYALADAALARSTTFPKLRSVVFGGEALQPARLSPWHEAHPEVRLINMFGITETCVHVTATEVTAEIIRDGRSFLGEALPAWGAALLDEHLHPVPMGTPGEICVWGAGVARGYLGEPEKTAERFVTIPGTHERIYRSGDLARQLSDGRIAYVGRKDDQVKIRGFRVELGEIERALLSLEGVRDAVAIPVRGGAMGESAGETLAAYIVLQTNVELSLEALQRLLAERIPQYMIPNAVFVVDAIPRTVNGKADRRALLKAGTPERLLRSEASERSAAPQTQALRETMEAIKAIWRDVLGYKDPIADDANFFLLGGHSLKANRAVVRLRERFGVALSLKAFFTAPTPALLAALMSSLKTNAASPAKTSAATAAPSVGAPAPDAVSRDVETPPKAQSALCAPASGAQKRIWVWQSMHPSSSTYAMVGGLRFEGRLDVERLQHALDAAVVRHEALRTHFETLEGELMQVVEPARPFTLECEDIASDEDIERILEEESRFVFELDEAPLMRVRLLHAPKGDRLIFNIHHIISDGWSVNVLMRDIAHVYNDDATELPTPMQPRELARREDDTLRALETLGVESKWAAHFLPAPSPLEIPSDRPLPTEGNDEMRGGYVYRTLSPETSALLRGLAQSHHATLFMVLAALVAGTLETITGARDMILGTPVAGRNSHASENTMAFLLNMTALRLRVNPSATFAEHLSAVRDETLNAFEWAEYPFERLLEKLRERGLQTPAGHDPLFDVMLILQNNDPLEVRLGGLHGELLSEISAGAKLSLNFTFEDREAIVLQLEYRTDMFDEDRVGEWADALLRAATRAAVSPDAALRTIFARNEANETHETRTEETPNVSQKDDLKSRLLQMSDAASDEDEW